MKKSSGKILFDILNNMFMVLLAVVTLYPFIYIIFASISDPGLLMKHSGPLLHPKGATLDAYKAVFNNPMIITGYYNTLIIVIFGTSLNVFLTSMGAYVLSRRNLYLKKFIMIFIVVTMFFSGGLIPSYLVVVKLEMLNTRLALIIPSAISAWNMIMMRTYFLSIPDSMEESAIIDGANDFTILIKIILPLAIPIVAVMILYYGVSHWNSWFGAMIYLKDRGLYPLQLVLREILIINSTDSMTAGIDSGEDIHAIAETVKYATIIVATIPILCIYPMLQKYFVKGVMIGALKG